MMDPAGAKHLPDPCGQTAMPLLLRFVDRLPVGGRVLEIGVEHGRHVLPLARRGLRVTGIDTDPAQIDGVRECSRREGLAVDLWQDGFDEFQPREPFDVVLAFDQLPILTRSAGASLIYRIQSWLKPRGLFLLTALHVDDPGYDLCRDTWEKIGLHSFREPGGAVRTFLARREILDLFLGWEILYHHEGLGPEHRHGGAAPERHGVVEVVARKRELPAE